MQCTVGFRSNETHTVSLWSDFKDISGEACLNRVDNNDAWIMYEIIIQEN